MAALRLLFNMETGMRYDTCGSHCSIFAQISMGKHTPVTGLRFPGLRPFFLRGGAAAATATGGALFFVWGANRRIISLKTSCCVAMCFLWCRPLVVLIDTRPKKNEKPKKKI
jgi:hypothetical protein